MRPPGKASIGDKVKIGGTTLKVAKACQGCKGCHFETRSGANDCLLAEHCMAHKRQDGRSVKFVTK